MAPPHFILASASPRRARLLRRAGARFDVIPAGSTELDSADIPYISPAEIASYNAWKKATSVAIRHPGTIVVGCDTVVALGAHTLGKPRNRNEARDMLRRLSGRVHAVISAVVIVRPHARTPRGFRQVTLVRFRRLTDRDIDRYLDRVHVLDKAGAYALQKDGAHIVEAIMGPADNVVGLPVDRLLAELCG